jgi:hypothetical protein
MATRLLSDSLIKISLESCVLVEELPLVSFFLFLLHGVYCCGKRQQTLTPSTLCLCHRRRCGNLLLGGLVLFQLEHFLRNARSSDREDFHAVACVNISLQWVLDEQIKHA